VQKLLAADPDTVACRRDKAIILTLVLTGDGGKKSST